MPDVETLLREALATSANPTGGWGYFRGKASRIEPTAWALLSLSAALDNVVLPHRQFLQHIQQPSGWLREDVRWPINIGVNAIALFSWLARPALATDEMRRRLIAALVGSRGVRMPQADTSPQNNALQGWSWIDQTFSWVEPTAWAVLALKKARRLGFGSAEIDARIAEAERLLLDRACRDGGWNFGNATMLSQDLRPYVPTSALGLLAMQDRRTDPVVMRGVRFLEANWSTEESPTALGLSLIALEVHGRPTEMVDHRLRERAPDMQKFGNLHTLAVALTALSKKDRARAFEI